MAMLMKCIHGDCISYSFLYVTFSHALIFHSHNLNNCMLKAISYRDARGIHSIPNEVQSAIIPSTKWPFNAQTQTIQLGIATTIILAQSFTLSQQGEQHLGKTLALAAGEYMTSQTQAAVEEAVKEVLDKDDGGDDKLSQMIIDIILKNSKITEVKM
ncbi:hypothetical protein M405DRAFT_870200 [Rhizopogon salebrosus TDB-379]|nr:hypothetical protein M405DRAFT_870200 [Rhizopogon salebrosus TDB-379]